MCEYCIQHNHLEIAERLKVHFADEPERLRMMLKMSPDQAAVFDDGDFQDADPRSRAALKASGDRYGRGIYDYQ